MTAEVSLLLMSGLPARYADDGWDVHVVTSPGPHLSALDEIDHVTTHPMEMRREPSPWHDLAGLLAWIRLIARLRPDVVDVGTPKAGLLGSVAAFLCRTPVRVYTLRGLRYESATGGRRRILRALERVACTVSTEVLAVSESLRRLAVDDRLAPADKVVVLGAGSSNGVDVDRFRPRADDEVEGAVAPRPVIGFIGRVHTDKGVDLLLAAVDMLRARGVQFTLAIVGAADDETGRLLLESAAARHPDTVLMGHVSDVADVLATIDILCLPTRREGFPNVVLEAAAAGIPAVATEATGVVDAIVDGVTGAVVPTRDPAAMAAALERYLTSPSLRREAGRGARQRVEQLYARPTVQGERVRYSNALLAQAHGRERSRSAPPAHRSEHPTREEHT